MTVLVTLFGYLPDSILKFKYLILVFVFFSYPWCMVFPKGALQSFLGTGYDLVSNLWIRDL